MAAAERAVREARPTRGPSYDGRLFRRSNAERLEHARPDLREGIEIAELCAGDTRPVVDERGVFSRVIGTRRGRVAAMVCRENQAVTCPQSIQDAWQLTVEVDQGFRVSVGVAAVAVLRVEVVEVREAKAAIAVVEPLFGSLDALVVVGCSLTGSNPLAAEYIADLAHAARRNPRAFEDLEHAR